MSLVNQPSSPEGNNQRDRSAVLIRLLKGPLYLHRQRDLWQVLLREQHTIREYFQQLGLSLLIDEAEGYAFLKQQEHDGDDPSQEWPRLISRRSLSFSQTLLVVSLRKRLAEHDSEESAPRLIVTRQEIHQWLLPYFREVGNEVKQRRDMDALIKKIDEMGFLSALPNHPDDFEVPRILKAFVTAEQIVEFNELLTQKLAVDMNNQEAE
ncbi:DUF4194 domain-containing protein [Aeromonas veronii]